MARDIIQVLRALHNAPTIANRAADEIERLRTENRKLRDVLIWSEQNCPNECKGPMGKVLIETKGC